MDVKYSVIQKTDGSLGVTALQMNDAATTSICFNISAYKNCVTIGADARAGLEIFVRGAFADAEKFAIAKRGK